MRKAFKKQRNQIGEINSQVEDTLLGIRVVKSFATEELEAENLRTATKNFLTQKNSDISIWQVFKHQTEPLRV